jgi:hypothetical protein
MKKILLLFLFSILSFVTFGASTTDNEFKIGKGQSSGDKVIKLGELRAIRSNETSGKLEQTEDGSTWKRVGSGSGSGTGDGINGFGPDDNANAEEGTTGWSNTGGAFGVTTADPLEGEQSFTFTPSAQNDVVNGPVLDFNKDKFKGRACEARIEYIGGDDNLELHVVDANGLILNKSEDERKLEAHTISAPKSVFFLCPTDTDIAGDANKGNLNIRVVNTGAVASPLIKWDLSYIGTLRGLVESTLPDYFTARVDSTGTHDRENVEWLNTSRVGTGNYTLDYSSLGLSNPPNCMVTQDVLNIGEPFACNMVKGSVTNTGASVYCNNGGGTGAFIDLNFTVSCSKTGSDAKQSVQVYKNIPKISENINSFSARIAETSGVILESNTNWAQVANYSAGVWTLVFNPGVFSAPPICTATVYDTGGDRNLRVYDSTTSDVKVVTYGGGGTSAYSFNINCMRQDSDFKMPTVQPILINQVDTSDKSGLRLNKCVVFNKSSASLSPECDSWVQSVARINSTEADITLKPVFESRPLCVCGNYTGDDFIPAGSNDDCSALHTSNTTIRIGHNSPERNMQVICVGGK